MRFDDLDSTTREYMEREFLREQESEERYRPKTLSPLGQAVFPTLLLEAIRDGNAETLAQSLRREHVDDTVEPKDIEWRVRSLALNEFNVWYVRGLAKRLLDEGVEECEVYRGAEGRQRCKGNKGYQREGLFPVRLVYDGHRAKYWPERNDDAFSIPCQGGCHHTIRRVRR